MVEVEQENKHEQVARLAFEELLANDEDLLSFSKGSVSTLFSQWYYIGLTDTRFILLPIKRGKPTGDEYSIWRDGIEPPQLTQGFGRKLKFQLPKDHLGLSFGSIFRVRDRFWLNRAKDLADLAVQSPPQPMEDDALMGQRHLEQARDYLRLDFPTSALSELNAALTKDPNLGMDPAIKNIREELNGKRLALKVGGAFFLGNVAVDWLAMFLFLLIAGSQFLGEFMDSGLLMSWGFSLWAGISLWRGRTAWRPWAIFVAALGFAIFTIINLLSGLPFDALMQVAYSGAIILVLTGSGSRTRTWIAIALYAIGFLGITFLQLLALIVEMLAQSI